MEAANQISILRQRINDIVDSLIQSQSLNNQYDTSKLYKVANELLHAPTMQLREGDLLGADIEDVVQSIENQLKAYLQIPA
jgi:hypothetical protein